MYCINLANDKLFRQFIYQGCARWILTPLYLYINDKCVLIVSEIKKYNFIQN